MKEQINKSVITKVEQIDINKVFTKQNIFLIIILGILIKISYFKWILQKLSPMII